MLRSWLPTQPRHWVSGVPLIYFRQFPFLSFQSPVSKDGAQSKYLRTETTDATRSGDVFLHNVISTFNLQANTIHLAERVKY